VSEAGSADGANRLVNLDPLTGNPRWLVELDPDERDVGVLGGGTGPWFVWSSFANEGDHRAPTIRRIDPATGDVVWQAQGREGSEWQWSPAVEIDNRLVMIDVFDDPESSAPGSGAVVHGFDSATGRSTFATPLDAPPGQFSSRPLLTMAEIDDEPVLLVLTTHGLLARLDPEDGSLVWTSRVNPGILRGTVKLSDGTDAIRVKASPQGEYLIDAETGRRLDRELEADTASDPDG
jgi:outer membrane protein assembly factor BamB